MGFFPSKSGIFPPTFCLISQKYGIKFMNAAGIGASQPTISRAI
jgi:hypothetical protein